MKGPLVLASIVLPSLAARTAGADELAPGLDYRVLPGAFAGGPVHVLEIDLTRFRVVQTDPTEPLIRSAAGFAAATGAVAVANSNFYVSASAGPPVGMMVGRGQVATDSTLWYAPPTFMASLGIRHADGFAAAFDSSGLLHGPAPDCLSEVFTGSEWTVRDGVVPMTSASTDQGVFDRHPRTVLGLSQDRTRAFVLVTQGRGIPAGALGYSVVGAKAIGHVALAEGAWDAINLDGGGSSAMWIDALGGIQNRPTDGQERLVAFHLGVVPAPVGEPVPPECAAAPDAGPDGPDGPDGPEPDGGTTEPPAQPSSDLASSCSTTGRPAMAAAGLLVVALMLLRRRPGRGARPGADRPR